MRRRSVLKSAALLLGAPLVSPFRALAALPDKPQAFDYAWLKGEARSRASSPHRAAPDVVPKALLELDWDRYQAIRFRPERALWANRDSEFRVRFFHLGRGYKEPVRMYELANSQARRIDYDPTMFDLSESGLDVSVLP